jgi:hypothetical protein
MRKFRWWLAVVGSLIIPSAAFAQLSTLNSSLATTTTITTDASTFIPAAPSSLTYYLQANGIYLSWIDNSTNELNFLLERQNANSTTWNTLTTLAANAVTYLDTLEMISGRSYNYRLSACTSAGCSAPVILSSVVYQAPAGTADLTTNYGTSSTTSSGTTLTSSTTPNPTVSVQTPNAPTNFSKLSEPTRTAIYLTWQDNSVDETNFNIERKIAGSLIWNSIARPPANNSGKGTFTDDIEIKAGTSYSYRIQACKEGYGCSDYSLSPIITTPAELDIAAPTPPTALVAILTPEKKVRLTWNASTDNVAVYKYVIFRNDFLYGSSATNEFIDISVYPGQTYKYYVVAFDASQNRSGTSNTFAINLPGDQNAASSTYPGTSGSTTTSTSSSTTTSGSTTLPQSTTISQTTTTTNDVITETPDLSPPTAPSNVTVATTTDFLLKVSWNQSTDDKGVRAYRVYRNGSLLLITPNTSFVDNYIVRGKTFTYYVVAVDVNDKISQVSPKAEGMIPLDAEAAVEKTGTLRGQIIDTDGKPVAKVIIHIWNSDGQNFYATSDDSGNYLIQSNAGNYKIEIFLPPNRPDLIRPKVDFTTLIAGEIRVLTQTVDLVKVYEKVLSGSVVYPNGQPVNDARVVAFNRANNQWVNANTSDTGQFTMDLSAGTWYVNINTNNTSNNKWLWDQPEKVVIFGDSLVSENKKMTFTVKEAPVKVKVKLINESNQPVANAGVSIERTGVEQSSADIKFSKSDTDGFVTFWVLPGRYIIRGFSSTNDLINPDDVNFSFSTGAGHEIVLKFKSRQAARGIISGNVALEDGTSIDGASVWGWSEMGQQAKTETDTNGNFYISTLPNDKWHLSANKALDGFPYRSGDITINVSGLAGSVNLKIFKPKNQLPPVVQVKQSAENPIMAVAKTGASIYIPSGAASEHTATSSVTVTIEASSDAPSRPNTRVVGNSYDVKVEDANGKKIEKFDDELEISLPYTAETLKALGVKDSAIEPSYFDEETGVWVRVKDFVINKDKKIVILKIKHLTRFALVAPADTIPPQAPTKLTYKVKSPGSVSLSWLNPSSDFHHVKIYRSDKKTTLGTLLSDMVVNPNYSEAGLKKTTYYYTLKTVDAAGNESQKNLTAAVNAAKVNTITKIPSGLKLGSSGDGVRLLQETLVKSGFLPKTFVITGKFDKATQDGVKKFQKSKKLSQVGTVGPTTATALNKLIK